MPDTTSTVDPFEAFGRDEFRIVEKREQGGFYIYYDGGSDLENMIAPGGTLAGPYKDRAVAEARLTRWRNGICDVCGSDGCGAEHVLWELYGEDEGLVRAGHALEEAMITYAYYSQLFDHCGTRDFSNVKAEVAEHLDRAIETLRKRRLAA